MRADGSAVETEGGYKDFNYSDPMNPANGFRPNLLIDFLRGSLYGRSVDLQGDITAETMNLKVCTNSDNELPNGSIILYPKKFGAFTGTGSWHLPGNEDVVSYCDKGSPFRNFNHCICQCEDCAQWLYT